MYRAIIDILIDHVKHVDDDDDDDNDDDAGEWWWRHTRSHVHITFATRIAYTDTGVQG